MSEEKDPAAGPELPLLRGGRRTTEIESLRRAGVTVSEIANRLGISRQRVYQLLSPATLSPEKIRARIKFNAALASGELKRPEKCSHCGEPDLIHGHHTDYARPLDVTWLCGRCHRSAHGCEEKPPKVHNDPMSQAAAALGKLGGKAGKGAAKRRSPEHYKKMVAARKGWTGASGVISLAKLNRAKETVRRAASIPLEAKAELSFSIDEVLDAISSEGRAIRIDTTATNGDGPKKSSITVPKKRR